MPRRQQSRPEGTLAERLAAEAKAARDRAATLPNGPEKAALIKRAEQCESTASLDGYLRSSELRPPE